MSNKKQQPIDTIFDIPIYFDKFNETFFADVDGRTIRRDSLKRIRQDLDSDRVFDINEHLIQVNTVLGDMKRVVVSRIDSYNQIHLKNGDLYQDRLAPLTEKNLALYKQYEKLTRQGWDLIHQAGELTHEVELLPKDYWIKQVKKLRKELPKAPEPPKTQEANNE